MKDNIESEWENKPYFLIKPVAITYKIHLTLILVAEMTKLAAKHNNYQLHDL